MSMAKDEERVNAEIGGAAWIIYKVLSVADLSCQFRHMRIQQPHSFLCFCHMYHSIPIMALL